VREFCLSLYHDDCVDEEGEKKKRNKEEVDKLKSTRFAPIESSNKLNCRNNKYPRLTQHLSGKQNIHLLMQRSTFNLVILLSCPRNLTSFYVQHCISLTAES
jgi:hypothetical protein